MLLCVIRGSRTPVFSMSYNHAENSVLLCIVSNLTVCLQFAVMQLAVTLCMFSVVFMTYSVIEYVHVGFRHCVA